MASYTAQQLNGEGTPTEVLTGQKTFTLTNPLSSSAYFTVETVRDSNSFYILSRALHVNSSLASNTVTCDVGPVGFPYTATIKDVPGGAVSTDGNGSGIEIAITSTGWDGVLNSGTGTITKVVVIDGGEGYVAGDTVTIARGTPGVQGLGFTNADNPLILTISAGNLKTSPTNALGSYATFTNITASSLITSSYISSVVVPSGGSSYKFTPTATVAISSSMLRATGGMTLTIS